MISRFIFSDFKICCSVISTFLLSVFNGFCSVIFRCFVELFQYFLFCYFKIFHSVIFRFFVQCFLNVLVSSFKIFYSMSSRVSVQWYQCFPFSDFNISVLSWPYFFPTTVPGPSPKVKWLTTEHFIFNITVNNNNCPISFMEIKHVSINFCISINVLISGILHSMFERKNQNKCSLSVYICMFQVKITVGRFHTTIQ